MDSTRISLGLACALVAAPFLLPEHRPPLFSFYDEWLGIALAAAAGAAFLLDRRDGAGLRVPHLALWLAGFSLWLGLQGALRQPAYVQLPLAGMVYVLLAAQLAWLGHALAARLGADTVVDALAGAILAAASVNAAIGIVQFYGVPQVLSGLLGDSRGHVTGHVGQRNLLAHYLAWGIASLLYLRARGRVASPLSWICGSLLVLATAYTLSRSAVLYSLWLAGLAFLLRHSGAPWRDSARRAGFICISMLLVMLALPRLHEILGLELGMFALERLVQAEALRIEPRPAAWALAGRLFLESPWLGIGWGEFAGAAFQAGLPAVMAAQSAVWSSPHSLPLHVLAEAGAAGAALLLAGAAQWWIGSARALRRHPTLPRWWAVSCVGIACLHSLLEYPLWYAHFLGLAALAAGVACTGALRLRGGAVRPGLLGFNGILAALLAWALLDFQRFDRAHLTATGHTLAPFEARTAALEELQAASHGPLGAYVAPWTYRWTPAALQGADALTAGERALRRSPDPLLVARHAATLSREGREESAQRLLEHAAATLSGGRKAVEEARGRLR